jgi:maltooligosyltrehalose trehalohydrolase
LHVALTGETTGWLADFEPLSALAKVCERGFFHDGTFSSYRGRAHGVAIDTAAMPSWRLVVCAQNHDQVGNRAFGDRLHGDRLRLAAFCSILAPGIPLLFMGEEYDEEHPFQFFTDHIDPEIAQATREGRRREFERFAAFAGEDVPDPQSVETFLRSKLDRENDDPDHRRYYRALLALRRQLRPFPVEAVSADEEHRVLRVQRGPVELVMNFSGNPFEEVPPWTGVARGAEGLAG